MDGGDLMPYEDRRWYDDVGGRVLMCSYCIHRREGLTCDAFPDGIPYGLLEREENDTPYPGDNGIRFQPKEKQE